MRGGAVERERGERVGAERERKGDRWLGFSVSGNSLQGFASKLLRRGKGASVYRVHIAQSRDVVLEFVPLFFQLSQAIRAYTVYDPFLMNIRVKSRQRMPFPTAWSYGSRDTQLLLPANSFRQSSFSNASISCILIS
ncbi:hypothetical protein YC2023_067257 [Brassica napus]